MSLLWRNHLRIGLAPERLILAAYTRGLRMSRASGRPKSAVVALAPAANAADWQAALEALPEVLAAHKDHEVSVVLADSLVRYALLPWNAALKTDEQWMSLARHRMSAVHGAAAADWELKLTETAPQGPRLACAADRNLLAELAARFVAANVRLVSVQPFLAAAFNRIRRTIGQGSCWLVVEEPGRLTLALIQHGTWTAIRSRRADANWRAQLPELIERESAFLALAEPCTRVIVCAQDRFDADELEAYRAVAVDYRELALAWEGR